MRFLPNTAADRQKMLAKVGVKSIDDLYQDVPKSAVLSKPLPLPSHQGEMAVEAHITALADQNIAPRNGYNFLGAGCYDHHIPATVDYIIQRSEFLTAYTPYQPEIAQGTLTYLFEFQSYVAALTGMDVANASMYDGATSLAEAALMAKRITKRADVLISTPLHPDYMAVLETYLQHVGGKIRTEGSADENTACVIITSPDFTGNVHTFDKARHECDESGALLIHAFTEVLSLGVLEPATVADIVVGEGQGLGVGMQFGGPHLGLFACKEKYIRQMPGRFCGQTTDSDGNVGYVLTLNTREQHIRRDKATSNICTNQGLCALAFTVHTSLLGEGGFKELANLNHQHACYLAQQLEKLSGVKVRNETFFNEFVVDFATPIRPVVEKLAQGGIMLGHCLSDTALLMCATEKTTPTHIDTIVNMLKKELSHD